ncbi:hypothetical protein HYW72_02530 [Candidatus Nomurabacteria bacterium]|nr:hypothetical protein [Candidatus Nomurabacteria bacterium]
MISKYFDKDNLHHAYLIQGDKEKILPEILKFVGSLKIKIVGNADVSHISLDSFKIEDARNLRSYAAEKSFSRDRKIFIISANNFLLEAQSCLLKMFEEPIENTHFFLVVPDANALLKTFVSRFFLIFARQLTRNDSCSDSGGGLAKETRDVERFLRMSLKDRIDFIRELLPKKDEENEEEVSVESNSSKALKFLNALEFTLHKQSMSRMPLDISFFEHFFKVRKFLRMPGSSPKTLMESVALVIPKTN